MSQHIVPVRTYVTIFAALLVLTLITIWVSFYDLGELNNVVALGIAGIKGSLVVLYFMHVRYGSRLVSVTVLGAFAWLVILIALTMSDYASRGWLPFPGK